MQLFFCNFEAEQTGNRLKYLQMSGEKKYKGFFLSMDGAKEEPSVDMNTNVNNTNSNLIVKIENHWLCPKDHMSWANKLKHLLRLAIQYMIEHCEQIKITLVWCLILWDPY